MIQELESGSYLSGPSPRGWPEIIRSVSWNINRGLQLEGVIDFLSSWCADLILLQETDINARRTGHRNVPREIAQALRMNYVFGREFEELAQGTAADPAYHGQTTLSRLPLSNARILRFREQSTFWQPRWYTPPLAFLQRRHGGRMALVSEITLGGSTLVVYNAHLESRGTDQLRMSQLSQILSDIVQLPPNTPVLMAGDFNLEISCGHSVSLIRAGMNDPFASMGRLRTVLKSSYGKAADIDSMLTRGALTATQPAVHSSVRASDHFPLSLELQLQ